MSWTRFYDMHSGGGSKEPQEEIYIEAQNEKEAKIIFYNRFGHSPNRVTCTCCGEDYSISTGDTLDKVSEYSRRNSTLETYIKGSGVLIIKSEDITPEERIGEVPSQGYVWVD